MATLFLATQVAAFGQGSLTPPGAPAPTMKTLNQVEPRTPIAALPFVITEPGSYYLVTNLTDTAGTNGITVQADNVTIDLSGFVLRGSGGGFASGSGIFTTLAVTRNLTVRNGSIVGWGALGVRADHAVGTRLENLSASGNGDYGFSTGSNSTVQACIANTNGGTGFYLDAGSVARGCSAVGNGYYGIEVQAGGLISDCSATANGNLGIAGGWGVTIRGCTAVGNKSTGILVDGNSTVVDCTANTNGPVDLYPDGIYAEMNSTISRCTAIGNFTDGIRTRDGCTIENCTASGNGTNGILAGIGSTVRDCTVRGNGDDGIEVPNDCMVTGNHCTANGFNSGTGAAIHTTIAGNRIEGNSAVFNARGLWIGGALNFVVRNTARYNPNGTGSNNFVIASGNMIGPTNTLSSGVITNLNPWANFAY